MRNLVSVDTGVFKISMKPTSNLHISSMDPPSKLHLKCLKESDANGCYINRSLSDRKINSKNVIVCGYFGCCFQWTINS
jgi:hypothetical protein